MWPFKRRPSEGLQKAQQAHQEARKELRKVERRGNDVSRVAEALRDVRERNHLGEALDRILNINGGTQ